MKHERATCLATEEAAPDSVEDPAVRRIEEIAEVHAPRAELATRSGRRVVVEDDGGDRLTVLSRDGRVELAVRFTDQGPVLSFTAASIELASAGPVAVRCSEFKVRAEQGIELDTLGDHKVRAGGAAITEANDVSLFANNDAQIDATGDVRVDGRRILLNS